MSAVFSLSAQGRVIFDCIDYKDIALSCVQAANAAMRQVVADRFEEAHSLYPQFFGPMPYKHSGRQKWWDEVFATPEMVLITVSHSKADPDAIFGFTVGLPHMWDNLKGHQLAWGFIQPQFQNTIQGLAKKLYALTYDALSLYDHNDTSLLVTRVRKDNEKGARLPVSLGHEEAGVTENGKYTLFTCRAHEWRQRREVGLKRPNYTLTGRAAKIAQMKLGVR